MIAPPPNVLFGEIDDKQIINYDCTKLSNEITIFTTIDTHSLVDYLKPTNQSADLYLFIDLGNMLNPMNSQLIASDFVSVILRCKVLGFLSENDNINQEFMLLLTSKPTVYDKLTEIVKTQLALFEFKLKQETLKQLFFRVWVHELLYEIAEEIYNQTNPIPTKKYKQDDFLKIKHLADTLNQNFQKTCPSLDEMAERVEMSPTKFKSIFKDVCGVSPHQYVLDLRLNQAKKLLRNRDLTVSEVAYRVGFNHPSALTRLFKNKLGASPNELIKK